MSDSRSFGGTARFSGRWYAGKRRSGETRCNDVTWRSHRRFVQGNGDLQLGWLPVLGQDQQLGGFLAGKILVTGFTMEPKVFFVGDWSVCIFTKVKYGRLCTGNCGAKEEMGCSESKVVLVIVGEGEAEWCGCTVPGEIHVMD